MANKSKNRYHPPIGSHTQNNHDPKKSRAIIRRIKKVAWTDFRGIYSASALARYCNVGDNTVRGWLKHGYFPSASYEPDIEAWCNDPLASFFQRANQRCKALTRRVAITQLGEILVLSRKSIQAMFRDQSFDQLFAWKARRFVRWTYKEWFEVRMCRTTAHWDQ